MDIGVFLPVGNNGWLVSTTAPQYMPTFELNRAIVEKAEHYGFDFALSMIKLHGFGGKTEFWNYNLESFTLMAGLAAVTSKIKLFASTAVLTLPPALVARMATTIDGISGGRFGVNIVSGWQRAEYDQMGLWPGDGYFGYRYDYSSEYVTVMKELWQTGHSDFKGRYFTMDDCMMKPAPTGEVKIVCAGQSARGLEFAATYGDYNFCIGVGINTPTAHAAINARLIDATEVSGRDVGAYVLFMVIADETDDAARARWEHYRSGADVEAFEWMAEQSGKDKTGQSSSAKQIALPEQAINHNIGLLLGSFETVARLLDEAASVPGTEGIMLIFDDWLAGLDAFGTKIQPLMACRSERRSSVASIMPTGEFHHDHG